MLWTAIRGSWPLFFGVLALMLANGLLLTLLTVRATGLGFTSFEIGIMQAGYPLGALAGCIVTPRIVAAVGHARAFGALASICSVAALGHMVTSDFVSWTTMRLIAGFCFPGLYVVAESWLNARAVNETRASLLSVYFVVQVVGSALGQLLLNIPDETGMTLFVLCSVLVSLSLVPMLLSPTDAGGFVAPARVSMGRLIKISPFGFAGALLNGMSQGMLYVGVGILAAFLAIDPGAIGLMVAAIALGAAVGQFPVGAVSDRIDRRTVSVICSLISMVPAAVLIGALDGVGDGEVSLVLILCLAAMGATIAPLYSLCVAQTNDRLSPDQVIPAAGALVLVLNIGLVIGPVLGAAAIQFVGPWGLFAGVIATQAAMAALGLIRMRLGADDGTGAAQPISGVSTSTLHELAREDDEER